MALSREPLFLARQTYRRRRLIDAMRLLPVVGTLFFMVPILGAGGRSTASAGIYLFGVWFVLIALAALITRRLSRAPGGAGTDPLEASTGGAERGDR